MEIKYFSMDNFNIFKGKSLNKIDTQNGDIHFVTAQISDNGIESKIKSNTYYENILSITANGANVGTCFYQTYKCTGNQDVIFIEPKNKELNKYIGMYLAGQFTQLSKKYTYGMKLNLTRFRKESIPLPTSDGINPDWDYIENTVKKIYEKQKKKAIKIKLIEQFEPSVKYFSMDNFNIFKGKSLNKIDTEKGDINFITAQISNNGIESKIKSNNYYQNILTITANGANVGTCFYQIYKCTGNQDVIFIQAKNKELNKYIGVYLTSQFTQLSKKYTYGMKLNLTRFKKEYIPLPCTPSGEIDWGYMENTVKAVIG